MCEYVAVYVGQMAGRMSHLLAVRDRLPSILLSLKLLQRWVAPAALHTVLKVSDAANRLTTKMAADVQRATLSKLEW